MTVPADYICHGSDHGTLYRGSIGGFYSARATPLACPLSDKDCTHTIPASQKIVRRSWVPEGGACWEAIDETGARFW